VSLEVTVEYTKFVLYFNVPHASIGNSERTPSEQTTDWHESRHFTPEQACLGC